MSVFITKMGLVSGLAQGVDAHWQAVLAGQRGIRPIERFDASVFGQSSAGILPPAQEDELRERWAEDDFGLCLIKEAVSEAIGTPDGTPDQRLGMILATNFGPMEALEWCWRERLDTGEMDLDTFNGQQSVVTAIASWLGAAGPTAELTLSCASGAAAVSVGLEWMQTDQADRVIVIAYDVLTEFCWAGLSNLRTITDDRVRPFDQRRRGTIFSEGAAVVLLERQGDICVRGAGTNNNAFHMTAPAKEADGSRRVMAQAHTDAGQVAIDFVSAHATGTKANDSTESAAIGNLLPEQRGTVPVAAFKSHLGHLLGAAGLAEIILSVKALQTGMLPGIINSDEHDEACQVNAVRANVSGAFQSCITNSAGIGGNNGSVVLSTLADGPPTRSLVPCQLQSAGWVVPGSLGHDTTLPTIDPAAREELAGFRCKPYISSVKGYLDPSAQFSLAAAAMCLKGDGDELPADLAEFAIVCASGYGAAASGYKFYEQLVNKGARFASPMIFPHSYANTPANLLAIEFGCAGAHVVFDRCLDANIPLKYAQTLLSLGKAKNVLVLLYEGFLGPEVPDDRTVTPGAVCMWLTAGGTDHWQPPFQSNQLSGILAW